MGPPLAGDFGMNLPFWYVRRSVFYLRHFEMWPDGGGWADQDAGLLEDIETYVRVEQRVKWEVKNGVPGEIEEEQQIGSAPIHRMDDL